MFSRCTVFIGLALIAVALCAGSVNADHQEERAAKCRELVKAHVDLQAQSLLLEEGIALCDLLCLKEGASEADNVKCVKDKLSRPNE